jgi:hypothetical protein
MAAGRQDQTGVTFVPLAGGIVKLFPWVLPLLSPAGYTDLLVIETGLLRIILRVIPGVFEHRG